MPVAQGKVRGHRGALSFRWENVELTKAELHMAIGSDYRRQPPSSGQAAHLARGVAALRERPPLRQCDRDLVEARSVFKDQLIESLFP